MRYKIGVLASASLLGALAIGAFGVAGAQTAAPPNPINNSTATITADPASQTIGGQTVSPPSCTPDTVCQLTSGETVNVQLPDNYFEANTTIVVAECAEVDGSDPTDDSVCDFTGTGLTYTSTGPDPSGNPATVGGALSTAPNSKKGIKVYTTVQPAAGSPAGSCTSSTPCVLYIGENQGDLAESSGNYYTFSQPFFFTSAPTVPETPYAVILPLAALGLLGGAWVIHRARHRGADVGLTA